LLQTHPGSLRSGSDHDWYARTRTTPDAKQNRRFLPFAAVSRRLSSGKPDALPLHDVNSCQRSEDEWPRSDIASAPVASTASHRRPLVHAEPYSPRVIQRSSN
jgi:hypothetical protein